MEFYGYKPSRFWWGRELLKLFFIALIVAWLFYDKLFVAVLLLPLGIFILRADRRRYIDFCYDMHNWTVENLKAGIPANKVPNEFYQKFIDAGYKDAYTYGPCHGTGMIEVEAPWMETTTDYLLEENMTFQVDTFISAPTFGCRWEKGIAVTKDGCKSMTDYLKRGIIEIDV